MRWLIAALPLLLAADYSWPIRVRDRTQERMRVDGQNPVLSGYSYALFEFAPPTGAGMTAACACTNPTGAKGEALTFARASSGTCMKGNTTTGIANGDMVTCSTDQPRIMPGGDGTGGNGILVETARTNSLLRSEAFDNAAWSLGNVGAGNPTVTANQAVAPDGTTTAERIQFPATLSTERTFITQSASLGAATGSVYLKGNGSSGTIQLALWDGAAYQCVTCSYNASTWSRCIKANVSGGGFSTWLLGNVGDAPVCNDGAHSAADVFVWGGQWEAGTYATSYIATAAAAVTRAKDDPEFSYALANTNGASVAATVVAENAQLGADSLDHGLVALGVAGPDYKFLLDYDATPTGTAYFYTVPGGAGSAGKAYSTSANTHERFAGWFDGATRNVIAPNGTTSGAYAATAATTLILIGEYANGAAVVGQANAVIKRVCVDSDPARCR